MSSNPSLFQCQKLANAMQKRNDNQQLAIRNVKTYIRQAQETSYRQDGNANGSRARDLDLLEEIHGQRISYALFISHFNMIKSPTFRMCVIA